MSYVTASQPPVETRQKGRTLSVVSLWIACTPFVLGVLVTVLLWVGYYATGEQAAGYGWLVLIAVGLSVPILAVIQLGALILSVISLIIGGGRAISGIGLGIGLLFIGIILIMSFWFLF